MIIFRLFYPPFYFKKFAPLTITLVDINKTGQFERNDKLSVTCISRFCPGSIHVIRPSTSSFEETLPPFLPFGQHGAFYKKRNFAIIISYKINSRFTHAVVGNK